VHEDFEACWRATGSRDRRFDGRFVVGVRTTGVYCLPSCPARMPRRENARFYPTSESARADGLRPCLRCRPDEAGFRSRRHVAERALEALRDGATVREVTGSLGIDARRLRADLVSTLGVSPAELARRVAAGADLELRLGFRPPLAFDAALAYLGPRALWGVEEVRDGRYRRLVRTHDAAVVEVEPADGHVVVRLPSHAAPQAPGIAASVRRLFDLDADPRRVGEALGLDPRLTALVTRKPGLRVTGAFDPFELAVRAILGQQVSVRGATTLARRLVERFGERVAADGALTHLFPAPASLAGAPIEAIGMPGARAEAIRGLSRAVRDGLALDGFSNPDALRSALVALPGIGPWTAEYVALRGAGDPDAFPASDLGLRHALGNGRPASAAEVERAAVAWRPWRGYAAMHLWRSLSGGGG
jgi:AraC family transcriptional regulator, regulatory protein of adaptative response / DNA-3-methyladenine glycosylase II